MDHSDISPKQIFNEYYNSLKTLSTCSNTVISRLTTVAKDKRKYSNEIIEAIEGQITKVQPELKLPLIYLIDSIIKNESELYPSGFSKNIRKIFIDTYRSVEPSTQRKLNVVLETWKTADLFSADILNHISIELEESERNNYDSPLNNYAQNNSNSHSGYPSSGDKRGTDFDHHPEKRKAQQKNLPGHLKQGFNKSPRHQNFHPQQRPQTFPSPHQRPFQGRQPYRPPPFRPGQPNQFPRPPPRFNNARSHKRQERPGFIEQDFQQPQFHQLLPFSQQPPYFNEAGNRPIYPQEFPNGEFGMPEMGHNPPFFPGQEPSFMDSYAQDTPDFPHNNPSFPPHQMRPPPFDHNIPNDSFEGPHNAAPMPFDHQFKHPMNPIAPHIQPPHSSFPPMSHHMSNMPPNNHIHPMKPPHFNHGALDNSMVSEPHNIGYQEPPVPFSNTTAPAALNVDHDLLKSLLDSGVLSFNASQSSNENGVSKEPIPSSVPMDSNTTAFNFPLSSTDQGTDVTLIVNLTQKDINANHKGAEKVLYFDQTLQCKQCGIRYPESQESQEELDIHMDWHFRLNRNRKERAKKAHSRTWYSTDSDWVENKETEFDYSNEPIFFTQLVKPQDEAAESTAKLEMSILVVPADHNNKPCPICHDTFNTIWSEEKEDWIYKNAVLVNDEVLHATCYSDNKVVPNDNNDDSNNIGSLSHINKEDIQV
ncbi:hypothetical protein K502DRAFT_322847 [Neoconidiobolus thromboides FSU 785]|nr:hypothetical protein K502DRAFT_322847 [Neoconidiobolus thromboides FSU 785]